MSARQPTAPRSRWARIRARSMPSSRFPEGRRGYTLLELAVALLVIAVLTGMLALPLAAQVEMRRGEETRRRLGEARDVLLAFAATHGRLPCPASATSRGEESFEPAG